MTTKRQTAINAGTAAAASDEHVRRLQIQLQSTAELLVALGRTDIVLAVLEQVVGASGSQAIEPGQPGEPGQLPAKRLKTAAATTTTPQPGVPRYVVPPATGDLAFRSSHWDGKPAEIHAMILKHASPLTRFLCGLLGDTATLDKATKLQLWTEAFKMDWQGDLALLPDVWLTADNGLLLAHSRSMYDRLCKRFPRFTETQDRYTREDAYNNSYDRSFYFEILDICRLLLIPLRQGWFDLVDFTYPITLARMAIRFGCLDLLKHLDDKYKTLQRWMAKHDPTSEYWYGALDQAARYGHLDVMQYLFDLGVTGCTIDAMSAAAYYGHLDVIKWLHENRTEGCTTKAMEYAAQSGHLHVIKWLHETRGEECTPRAVDAAISSEHVDVVKYLHSKGGRASSDVVKMAASYGKTKVLPCLLDLGYAVELGTLNLVKKPEIVDTLFGSLTLDRAQELLAQARQDIAIKQATVERLQATIKKRQASSMR